jgi:hypothetical protein
MKHIRYYEIGDMILVSKQADNRLIGMITKTNFVKCTNEPISPEEREEIDELIKELRNED